MSERMWLDEQLEKARTERDGLRARVAEQEATIAALRARVAQLEEELRLARMHPYGAALRDNGGGR